MERSSYTQSTTVSTRTFQTAPPTAELLANKPTKVPRTAYRFPRLLSARRLPWAIVVLLVASSLFLFSQYQAAQSKLRSPQTATATTKQLNDTLGKVAKLVIVPKTETPTVATVANAAKLKNQSFFANAMDGDKVIVYAQAKEAILYRPSTNQIVTIAPVSSPTK